MDLTGSGVIVSNEQVVEAGAAFKLPLVVHCAWFAGAQSGYRPSPTDGGAAVSCRQPAESRCSGNEDADNQARSAGDEDTEERSGRPCSQQPGLQGRSAGNRATGAGRGATAPRNL